MSKMKQMELFNLPKVESTRERGRSRKTVKSKVKVEGPILVRNEWPYEYVTNPDRLPDIAEDLSKHLVLGFDSETLGKDPHLHEVRLIQLTRHGKTYLLDYGKMGTLGAVSKVLSDGALKVGHFLKFDTKMMQQRLGLEPGPLFCTHAAAKVLDAGKKKKGFSLYDIALKFLGLELDKTEQMSDWSGELTEKQLVYAAVDGEAPLKLHPILMRKLSQHDLVSTARLEFSLIPAVSSLELVGIKVDEDKWMALAERNEEEREGLDEQMRSIVEDLFPGKGDSFNPRSPIQVKEVLKKMGLRVQSTGVDAIKRYRKKYPFVQLLLDYRDYQTKCGTFGMNFLNYIHPETGRIHPEFDPFGSGTGRYSCSNPNIINIPSDARWRECFIPQEGYSYIVSDFSQIELRIAACISKDEEMIRAYQDGEDIHRLTASIILGVPPSSVTLSQRRYAKPVNFGLIYGMSADTLSSYAKNKYGVEMSYDEAQEYRKRFFRRYKGLREWHGEAYRIVNRGVVEMRTVGGRSRQWVEQKVWVSHILNTPVQGTAADGMKRAHTLLYEALKPYGVKASIVNVIHDEMVVEVEKGLEEEIQQIQRDCMVKGMEEFVQDVPVVVDSAIGDSWNAKS